MTMRLSIVASAIAAAVGCGGGDDATAAESSSDAPTAEQQAPTERPPMELLPGDEPLPLEAPPPIEQPPMAALPSTEPLPSTEQAQWHSCTRLPATAGAGALRSARDFGAVPDDGRDDSDALQRGLDALKSGETLKLSAGRYQINRSLHIRQAGSAITGDGATLHATNADDMALFIDADNVTVSNLTFTAVTSGRRSAPRHGRIVVYYQQPDGALRTIRNSVIRNNRIVPGGEPGTAEANASSATGIMLQHADGFLVAENTVVRTLADGIHMTAGTRNGRVLNNTVREVGDDLIAVVSYAASGTSALNTAAAMRNGWDGRVDRGLSRNILIANNQGSGQYSGRGITVVGGDAITIGRNTLTNVPVAAAFLVAREANYQTFGSHNVLIEGNVVRDAQNLKPPYDPFNKFASGGRTGHGAIEIHAAQFADEAADPVLRKALAVRNVVARNNIIERSSVNAMRIGVNMSKTVSATNAGGQMVSRSVVNALLDGIWVQNNKFNQIAKDPIAIPSSAISAAGIGCSGNQRDGNAYSIGVCKIATSAPTTGATLSCGSDGRVL